MLKVGWIGGVSGSGGVGAACDDSGVGRRWVRQLHTVYSSLKASYEREKRQPARVLFAVSEIFKSKLVCLLYRKEPGVKFSRSLLGWRRAAA